MASGAALLASYPVFIERSLVQVNNYRIPVPRLPPAFEGFTIVQLTDLHYGPLVSYRQLQRVVERANAIPRDITVCTGDYVQELNKCREIDKIWPLLGTLHAPKGVFSVLGNHDHWADTGRSLYWLDKTGQDLRRQTRKFERNGQALWIAGAGDYLMDRFSIDALAKPIPENDCRIVLAHNPDSADSIYDAPPDLMISGHTHGGQINIPFIGTPILPVNNKNYSSGLKKSVRGFPVFISRGIGWANYPVRFNCYPEIAVLHLTSKTS
jgi:predicted MPP superfamily phosphohydrolase